MRAWLYFLVVVNSRQVEPGPSPVVPPPPVDIGPPCQERLDLLQVVEGAGPEEEQFLQGDGRLYDVAHPAPPFSRRN